MRLPLRLTCPIKRAVAMNAKMGSTRINNAMMSAFGVFICMFFSIVFHVPFFVQAFYTVLATGVIVISAYTSRELCKYWGIKVKEWD